MLVIPVKVTLRQDWLEFKVVLVRESLKREDGWERSHWKITWYMESLKKKQKTT